MQTNKFPMQKAHAFFLPVTATQFSPDAQLNGYLWLIAGLVLLMLELTTPGLFFFISFAVGCVFAGFTAFFDCSFVAQCVTGIITSGIALLIMRSYFVSKKQHPYKTNIDALLHQTGIVTAPIEPKKPGRVKIRGEEWAALATEAKILQKGTSVTVIHVEGNKVIVK